MKNRKINFIKLGILLFGVSIILWNCVEEQFIENEPVTSIQINAKTVSFKDAIAHFNAKNEKIKLKRTYAKTTKKPLEVTPDWNTLEFNNIAYTDANLTTANTEINREGKYSSQLYFINVNDNLKNVIFTIWKDEVDVNGNIINGRIYFNDLEGKFIDAYRIENGSFTKRFIVKKQIQKASFLPLFLLQYIEPDGNNGGGTGCWNTDNLPEDGVLDEVVIHSNDPNWHFTQGPGLGGGNNYNYQQYVNNATNGFSTNGAGSYNLSSGQVTSAAAAILMAAPIEPDENGNCPNGYKKNPTTGKCESICTGGKFFNETSKKCECPEGMNEDDNGNCVNKPCKGNPIKGKLEVAPQKGKSKTKGALHGCNRYGGTCAGGTDGRNKFHAGIDIKSSYGNPIYAMYDGFIYSSKFHKKAGWNIRVQSTVNGKTILVSYFHLQKENRLLATNPLNYVKAGDIIGYQGDSGNLKGAIKSGGVESHVHIEIREHNGSSKWGYKNFNLVDPRTYFSTTIKDDGTSESNTNCN